MADYSEIDALREANEALAKLTDSDARQRVLTWLWDKFSTKQRHMEPKSGERQPRRIAKGSAGGSTAKRTTAGRPSFEKSLNLRPKGKDSFTAFAAGKKPANNYDKCTVAVYYLQQVLGQTATTMNAVFTCYKEAGWRVPSDLRNALQSTASRKGWLDTKDTSAIKITMRGENHVEHDLPPVAK